MDTTAGLIGLIGGMSWESSALYYRLLNREVQRRLGGQHNASSVMYTLDFAELDKAAGYGNWDLVGDRVAKAARHLEQAGAEFLLITSVTGHIVYDQVQSMVGIPVLHIADSVAGKAKAGDRVGLVGTRFTLSMPHITAKLEAQGLDIVKPRESDQELLQRIISDELQQGHFLAASREAVNDITLRMASDGASAVIVGCTELPLLMSPEAYPIPTYDLVQLHIEAAIAKSLGVTSARG